jgi:phage terminase large subunit-like protein
MKRGDGQRVVSFIESLCRTTKDTYAGRAGELLKMRPWQSRLIGRIYARRADGRRKHRVGLVGVPRKNGKSAIGSSLALEGLFMGPAGGEVYSCAADKEQAKIVFGVAKRMVELDPDLEREATLYKDAIEIPDSGSVYRVLSSEAYTKEGLSPTLVIYDELHAAPNDDLWNVMNLGTGARIDPLILAITTAGVRTDITGQDSICYRLYQHGLKVISGEVSDPSFFMSWWEAPPKANVHLPATWRRCNPGYDDLIDPEDFASSVVRTTESEFTIKRTNQWVSSVKGWLPAGSWEALAEPQGWPEPGVEVVLAFDGSYNRDSSAIIGMTVEPEPYGFEIGVWEQPADQPDWVVPRGEIDRTMVEAFERWQVVELACDRAKWFDEFERWSERFGDVVVEFPQSRARMIPACAKLYAAIAEKRITHDGSPIWTRHLVNAETKETPDGVYIVKSSRSSERKIDAAVAGVMAYDRAIWRVDQDEPIEVGAWSV